MESAGVQRILATANTLGLTVNEGVNPSVEALNKVRNYNERIFIDLPYVDLSFNNATGHELTLVCGPNLRSSFVAEGTVYRYCFPPRATQRFDQVQPTSFEMGFWDMDKPACTAGFRTVDDIVTTILPNFAAAITPPDDAFES
jgi:hypothetical protein